MPEWVKSKKYPGVRFRVHPTRKDGVEPAKYVAIFYKLDGKMKQETIGWSDKRWSEVVPDGNGGVREVLHKINEKRAYAILSQLQENQRLGRKPRTLKEMREMAQQAQQVFEAELAEAESKNMTMSEAFDVYLASAKVDKKDWAHDQTRMVLHVLPHLGDKRLTDVSAADIEMLKIKSLEKNHEPATIKHILQCVRVLYNFCIKRKFYSGENPTLHVKFPKVDNARRRFFSDDQVDTLLSKLEYRHPAVHDMALLSFLTGMRFGEIANLLWQRVDFDNGVIYVVDTKNGETREAYIASSELESMLRQRKQLFDSTPFVIKSKKSIQGLVFPGPKHGGVMKDIPDVFKEVVNDLGYNKGYTDKRQKLTFHSCRHTFGSRLAMQGVPLLTLKELMGHKTIEMTLRYAHLMPDHKRDAVANLRGRKISEVVAVNE